jgi:hypothetical protein
MGKKISTQSHSVSQHSNNQVQNNSILDEEDEFEVYPTASTNYKFKDVRVPYRSEKLLINQVD